MKNRVPVDTIVNNMPLVCLQANIPLEWFESYPVPVVTQKVPALEFFMGPSQSRPEGPSVIFPPQMRLIFEISGGKLIKQAPTSSKDYGLTDSPNEPLGEHDLGPDLDIEGLIAHQVELYTHLDKIIDIYPEMPLEISSEYMESIIAYKKTFDIIAHKPLLPYYTATNPEFFRWIEELASKMKE